ncbi:hypothetical protein LJR225_002398 [Phenylobacterium sp. LjRoot225]|uniref:hypothetical protein n=1 Tax=Phenylobacterium sp. LjRoot225 TaxID=3342285 RepID=UPI003ECD6723
MRHRRLEPVSQATLDAALARTPLDHFVIWDGSSCGVQANSLRSRALSCVTEIWSPLSMRALLQRAACIGGELGLDPDTVRSAVRMHQSARPAAYLLVRRTLSGDYMAVTDVPWPAATLAPLRAGDLVLDRKGRAFGRPAPPDLAAGPPEAHAHGTPALRAVR